MTSFVSLSRKQKGSTPDSSLAAGVVAVHYVKVQEIECHSAVVGKWQEQLKAFIISFCEHNLRLNGY